MLSDAKRLFHLFAGFKSAHGTHGVMTENAVKGGKLEIRKTARTIREDVTEEKWQAHIDGKYPLGIIPISENQTCVWGCIDVDKYDLDLGETVKELESRKLPLVLCRSKSGGAHVFLFLTYPEPAANLRAVLKDIAASLGWGDCEIFPKQNTILAERGDLGNWLNMPYLGGDQTDRYAVKKTMAAYSLREFLNYAESMRVNLADVHVTKKRTSKTDKPVSDGLSDGPPCLQHMCDVGFPSGQGNSGFFAFATYCKKKYGSKWKEKLDELNRLYFDPPRPAEEVADVIKRMDQKDYNYRCKDVPLSSFCNSPLCRMRKFGVGGAGAYPEVSGLTKLQTDPPIWFMDIEGERIELSTRQLQNYREFQAVCMDQLTIFFMPIKNDTWAQIVGDAMSSAVIIEAAPELSVRGHFLELLEAFCVSRHRGENVEDVLLGKPWQDPETGRHIFRLSALMTYLNKEKFVQWGRNTVGKVITEELGGRMFKHVAGKGVNLVYVNADFYDAGLIPIPKTKKDPF